MLPELTVLLTLLSSSNLRSNLAVRGDAEDLPAAPRAMAGIAPATRFVVHAGSELYPTVAAVRFGSFEATKLRSGWLKDSPIVAISEVEMSEDEALRLKLTSAGMLGTGLTTSVDVFASPLALDTAEGFQRPITAREVETSAGTFGDISRFMQTLAGVVSDNDQRNDVLVRGGNPSEDLFMIDNIEIPSINQLALSDTTGGFVSMLDANAIQQVTLHTDAYDSKFEQRLSSVVEVSTRTNGTVGRHSTSEVGIAGVGGSVTRPLGADGSLFFSGRRSVLQYFTDDIGMNGMPVYSNGFVRAENRIDGKNSWWGLSLAGVDSIVIHPSATDSAETNAFKIAYSGWRNTTGLNWQHLFSEKLVGVASVAQAEQNQVIAENGQLQDNKIVYNENTTDGITTAKYDLTWQANSKTVITAGGRASVDRLDYAVAQPIGLQNPYSEDPEPVDVGAFGRKFATVESSAYAQAAVSLPAHAELVVGGRAMQWALGGNLGATGKALISVPLFHRLFHVGYAEYEQMPPTLYMLAFNNISTLKPIKSKQVTTGWILSDSRRARVTLEAYYKRYEQYPVSTDHPQLSLANIADSFGQAFLLFPMEAKGLGLARGVELSVQQHMTSRLNVTETLTYSRTLYTGLDGVWRRGNFDYPLAANFTGVWNAGRGMTVSWRYSARPRARRIRRTIWR